MHWYGVGATWAVDSDCDTELSAPGESAVAEKFCVALLVVFICLWPMAMIYEWPIQLVTNFSDNPCRDVAGAGWHAIGPGPDKYHTWCGMDKP